MLKVGVIGAGSMGRHHVRIYAGMAECELLGVADPDTSRSGLAAEHGTQYFSDHRALLELKPDLLTIAAPTTLHYDLAKEALEADCHLLIEKPVTDDLGKARELIALAESKGKLLSVGHIERFNPAVVALKALIDAGELGEVLNLSNLRAGPYHGRSLDIGIILDLATHDVDMQAWLLGARAQSVFATSIQRVHNHEDHAVLQLALADGRTGVIEEAEFACCG